MIYAVCLNLQEKEITEYCFKKCGEIIAAGIIFNDLMWFPCRHEDCPYLDRQQSVGKVDLNGKKKEELVLRKLVVSLPSSVEVKEP